MEFPSYLSALSEHIRNVTSYSSALSDRYSIRWKNSHVGALDERPSFASGLPLAEVYSSSKPPEVNQNLFTFASFDYSHCTAMNSEETSLQYSNGLIRLFLLCEYLVLAILQTSSIASNPSKIPDYTPPKTHHLCTTMISMNGSRSEEDSC